MDILQLQEMGAFVPTKLVKKTIEVEVPIKSDQATWEDPEVPEFTGETETSKIDLNIKRLSSADEIAMAMADPNDQGFVMVHRMVRTPKGEPLFESVDQAVQLASWLLVPILNALREVAQGPKKNSRGKTPSGSKSRSRSGDGPRKSGSTPSAPSGETSSTSTGKSSAP